MPTLLHQLKVLEDTRRAYLKELSNQLLTRELATRCVKSLELLEEEKVLRKLLRMFPATSTMSVDGVTVRQATLRTTGVVGRHDDYYDEEDCPSGSLLTTVIGLGGTFAGWKALGWYAMKKPGVLQDIWIKGQELMEGHVFGNLVNTELYKTFKRVSLEKTSNYFDYIYELMSAPVEEANNNTRFYLWVVKNFTNKEYLPEFEKFQELFIKQSRDTIADVLANQLTVQQSLAFGTFLMSIKCEEVQAWKMEEEEEKLQYQQQQQYEDPDAMETE